MRKYLIFVFILFFAMLQATNWEIQLLVQNNSAYDNSNFLGKDENSSDGHDNNDILEFFVNPSPPYVSFYFPHPDWENWAANYTRDIRSDARQNEIWNFEIDANPYNGENYQISWLGIDAIPLYYDINLEINENSIDMRSEENFSFESDNSNFQGSIILTINNHPPEIISPIPTITLTENLNSSFNFYNYFVDADDDLISFSTENLEHIDIEFPIFSQDAIITPEQSWFGSETFLLIAQDSKGESVSTNVNIIVNPSQPASVSNLQINISGENIHLSWTAVGKDIYEFPIQNVFYNVYASPEADFPISAGNKIGSTSATSLSVPIENDTRLFFKVTAINGESLDQNIIIKSSNL